MSNIYQKGLTLTEWLIAGAIGAFVIVIAIQMVSGLSTTQHSSAKGNELNQARDNVFNELNQEIHWATKIHVSPHKIDLEKGPDKKSYMVQDGVLYRVVTPDRFPLTPDDVTVESFDTADYSDDPDLALVGIYIKLVHNNKQPQPTVLEAKTVLSQRKL